MNGSHRFRVLVPTAWGIGCVIGFSHPGDEYGLFALGSVAGIWAALLIDTTPAAALGVALLAGGAVMFGLGALLDALRAPVRVWVAVWLTAAVVACGIALSQFASIELAVRKNGSLLAYAAFASQAGVYVATFATIVLAAVRNWFALVRADVRGERFVARAGHD